MCRRSVVLILAIALAPPLSAQRLERSHVAMRSLTYTAETVPQIPPSAIGLARSDSSAPVAPMILSGLLFGAAGMLAGGYLGHAAETSGGCDDELLCGIAGAVLGGVVGVSFGVSGGIHMAGPKGHSYAGDVAVALGIGAFGLVAAPMTGGLSLLAVPVAQLFVGTYKESKAHR